MSGPKKILGTSNKGSCRQCKLEAKKVADDYSFKECCKPLHRGINEEKPRELRQ